MRQLYVATITREVVIVADSLSDAKHLARMEDTDFDAEPDIQVEVMNYLPWGWDVDCIPYGDRAEDDSDRTIQEWIDAGAGEAYLAMHKKLLTRTKTP